MKLFKRKVDEQANQIESLQESVRRLKEQLNDIQTEMAMTDIKNAHRSEPDDNMIMTTSDLFLHTVGSVLSSSDFYQITSGYEGFSSQDTLREDKWRVFLDNGLIWHRPSDTRFILRTKNEIDLKIDGGVKIRLDEVHEDGKEVMIGSSLEENRDYAKKLTRAIKRSPDQFNILIDVNTALEDE